MGCTYNWAWSRDPPEHVMSRDLRLRILTLIKEARTKA
jgi:hypothetical protein